MIAFIGAKNEQAYYSEYLIKKFTVDHSTSDTHAYYPTKFNFKDTGSYVTPGVSMVIIVGLGFKSSEQESFDKSIEASGNPNVKVLHFASWGNTISGVLSNVSEVDSPIEMLYKAMTNNKWMKQSELAKSIVDAVTSYHKYDFTNMKSPSLLYKSLADAYGKEMAPIIIGKERKFGGYSSAVEFLKDNIDTIRLETEKRNDYIIDRAETATVTGVYNCEVIMVYAESYVNELAEYLIQVHQGEYTTGMVVFVGKHTRGSDMFSIRTAGDVDAGEVAKALGNREGGKPQVATVFLTRPMDSLLDVVARQLLTVL